MRRLVALVALVALGCAEVPEPPTLVVLIVVDTLRADRTSVYGHRRRTTPALEAFAADALRYERAMAQAPWTTPSVGSLLTSRYPSELGIARVASPLPGDVATLPELLRDAGFATAGVVSHSFVSSRWGFGRGFDVLDESNVKGQQAVTSAHVSDRAIELLDRNPEGPLFLFVHYFDPHFALLEHEGQGFPREEPYAGPVRPPVPFLAFGRRDARIDAADAREMRRIYDSEVAFTDHHVGRLLDHLRARGRYAEALVVVTADHGEEFLDHGRIGHTKTLYQELLRVPLLVKLPHGPSGSVARSVGLVDVAPTVLEAVGVAAPPSFAGRSLRDETPRPVFSETSRQASLRSVVQGRWKLVHDLATGRPALYDLAEDPGEQRDLATRHPERLRALAAILRTWKRQTGREGPSPPALDLSPTERERLRELGYAE